MRFFAWQIAQLALNVPPTARTAIRMVALIATLVIIGSITLVCWTAPLELARIVKDIVSHVMLTVTHVTLNQAAPHV